MYTVTSYPQGTFSWADYTSPEAKKAETFYTKLMGWDTQHVPMGDGHDYTLFKLEGHDVAGLGPGEGPSRWTSYVAVDDVDAMGKRATELGGTLVMEPMDVFDNGRMLVLQDPTGAMLALWEAKSHIGAGIVNKAGAMCWNELATRDVETAKSFYADLLGWTYQPYGEGYDVIMNNERMNGGIMPIGEDWGEHPPVWSVYFTVEDVEKAVSTLKELGGTLNMPIMDSDGRRTAVVTDPVGGVFNLIQAEQLDPWIEADEEATV